MRYKSGNCLLVCGISLLLLVSFGVSGVFAQSEAEAEQLIQQASDKLNTVLSLLEELTDINEEVRIIVSQTDNSLQLINEAKQLFKKAQYILSIQKTNEALALLEDIEAEIAELNKSIIKESWLLYGVVGVTAAFATFGFIFLFFKKIHPWFRSKQIEEYGHLEIIYDKEHGEK